MGVLVEVRAGVVVLQRPADLHGDVSFHGASKFVPSGDKKTPLARPTKPARDVAQRAIKNLYLLSAHSNLEGLLSDADFFIETYKDVEMSRS